ncbi:hypothetical protein Emag_007685 [Eimeria magna]
MDQQATSRGMMSEFLGKLQELQLKAGYSSRIVFRIQDLLDLRQRRWTKKVFTEVAKSVAEIREDVSGPHLTNGLLLPLLLLLLPLQSTQPAAAAAAEDRFLPYLEKPAINSMAGRRRRHLGAKRDELMGGTIMVAQDGVFRTVGQRRDMPYNDYIEEQRQRAELKRAAALAGAGASVSSSSGALKAAAAVSPSGAPAGSAAAPKVGAAATPAASSRPTTTATASSLTTGGAFSRSSVTPASGAAGAPAAASGGAASGGAASAGSAGQSSSSSSSASAVNPAGLDAGSLAMPLLQDVDLLVFEFVTEGAPIEWVTERDRQRFTALPSGAALASGDLWGLGLKRAPRYAILICKLLIEHLQATKELRILMETLDSVVLSQLHEVAVDNPRAPEFCGDVFGPFFAAQTQGPSPLGEMINMKLLFPLPESEAIASKVCNEILKRVEKETPDRMQQLRSVFEASLAARVPGCSAAAAEKLLSG